PGASPPGTPNWPKLAGKVPAQRHQSPGTSSIGTNVHFPQVLARQAFQESYPPDPAWHKDFTKVHIFTNMAAPIGRRLDGFPGRCPHSCPGPARPTDASFRTAS